MRRSLRPALAALCLALLGAAARPQVPPGSFLAVGQPASAGLFAYEPLAPNLSPIADPLGVLARAQRVALADDRSRLLAAVDAGAATGTAMIVECTLQGLAISGFLPRTRDLGEAVVGLGELTGGLLVIATPTRLLVAGPGVTQPLPLAPAPMGTVFVGLAVGEDRVAALARGAAANPLLVLAHPASSSVAVHQLAIPGSRALAFDLLRGALLVGDAGGNLWLLDLQRFIASFVAGPLPGAVLAIGRNGDDGSFAIATPAGIFDFDGAGFRGPTPAPPLGHLEHRPYASRFVGYGQGCSGAGVAPAIGAVGRPYPGSIDFSLRMSGGAPNSAAFLLLGVFAANLPLDPTGMLGCTLFVQPLDATPYPCSAAGIASARFPIPPLAALAGGALHCQWIAVANGANALGLLASDGGRIVF
ncbi:MAG: hypothetical protein IT457_05900 [Planctomycetes bacterium]|nr:hypothetical protein [Planctomycetota bacterium]